MGIDIYLRWAGQTDEERAAQLQAGFSIAAGEVGYLREAYHGGPYATMVLVPEAFAAHRDLATVRALGLDVDEHRAVAIPVATLRGRLEAVCGTVIRRAHAVYGEHLTVDAPEVRAFVDFVTLAERLDREGRHPRVYASF